MSTRKSIIEAAVRRIGGKTGSISSGTATTAVLSGVVDTTGDDNAYDRNWLLWMMDAATAADQEKTVSDWDDATGTATFATRADTDYSDETFCLVPPGNGTLAEWRAALNDMLTNTRRNGWYVTKTVAGQLYYSLSALSPVRTREDVVAVYRRNHTPSSAAGAFEAFDFTANYHRYPIRHKVIEANGEVYIELPSSVGADQELVVVVREAFPALTADTGDNGTTECPDSVAVPGLLYYLFRRVKPNEDRERPDRIEARVGREYAAAARSLTQIPSPETQRRVIVSGA